MLLDPGAQLKVADPVVVRFERSGPPRLEPGLALSGRVVRVVADPARAARAHLGVAFDAPMPEDELMTRVSLSQKEHRGSRGESR